MLARASRFSPARAAASATTAVASTSYAVIRAPPRQNNVGSSKRLLTSSTTRGLPRQLPRRTLPETQEEEEPVPASEPSTDLSGTQEDIPWFLQTETVDRPTPPASPSPTLPAATLAASTFSYIPENPKLSEPKAIASLKSHLLTGPSSNLIARPNEEEADQLTPITLIHPASLSRDPSSDAYGSHDWIVVVQVKSSAAGSVRRVAQDIGRFLKHVRPPAVENEIDLDTFLGPDPSSPRYSKTAPKSDAGVTEKGKGPRPKGMSRIEHELGKSLPDWAVHRIALQKKFPDGWRPPKILSREAQEGIRLLHGSDPEQFDVRALSERFRVSTEAIRRILGSGKWAVSGEVRSRQDRRAAERAASRESSELAEIRRLQDLDLVSENESPIIEQDEWLEEDEEEGIVSVRYEGLVMSASDAATLGVTNKGKAGGRRGDGNWCLVDAEWCMVHVMTEQARYNYDIEGIWRELEVGKSSKPKPWEQTSLANAAPERPARPRTRRDMFGSNLGKSKRTPNEGGFGRFGDSRSFSTTTRLSKGEIPESMASILRRAQENFSSSSTSPIPVSVSGWLRSTRKQKYITFLELSDGSLPGPLSLQAVIKSPPDSPFPQADRLSGLTVGTATRLTGHLSPGRGSKSGQGVELSVESIEILSPCDAAYPLTAATSSLPTPSGEGYSGSLAERRNPHLLARLPRYAAIARTRQRLESGMATYLNEQDFVKVSCPIITSSDCEGAGETFQVLPSTDLKAKMQNAFWGGDRAFLTVSSQLHLEAQGLGLGRVWTMNPAFRAEGSQTNRHLAEFWMLEVEQYFTDLQGILDLTEGLIKAGIEAALEGREDMNLLADSEHLQMLQSVLEGTWRRVTYTEAIELLSKAPSGSFDAAPTFEGGLASEHERFLASHLGPCFVTHYPLSQKAFYMKRAAEPGLVEAFDLLIPSLGELVGGSVREHRPEQLKQNMQDKGIKEDKKLSWYTEDLKRWGGGVEHAGFGLGVERLLSWVTRTESVRDVVPFARVKGPIRF